MLYTIKMSKENFFKINNKILASNVIVEGEDVYFDIELGSFKILKKSSYPFQIVETLKNKAKRIYNRYYLIILGIIIMFSILFINSYRVKKIIFNKESLINEDITEVIESSYKRLLSFNFINIDFYQLSNDLSKKYFEYPYINVSKKNNYIYVDISDIYEQNTIEIINKGNLISKDIAIVDSYYVYEGKCDLYKNKLVMPNDVLISGDNARGVVLGYVHKKVNINVKKEEKSYILTDNVLTYYKLNIFNYELNLNKNGDFLKSDVKIEEIFNIFDFFSIKKIVEFEKNAIINTYTLNEGKILAENRIIEDFNKNLKLDEEKIISITNVSVVENDDSFDYCFIVKSYESLGIYEE